MGAILNEMTANPLYEPTLLTIDASPGWLNSLCCFSPHGTVGPAEAFAEIGILNVAGDISSRSCILATGGVGTLTTVFFSGKIPLYPDDFLMASIQSSNAVTFRLVARIQPFNREEIDSGIFQ